VARGVKNLLKILAIYFTPAKQFLNRSGPWPRAKGATGKEHDLPHACSLCELEAQRSQSKKAKDLGMTSPSLRSPRESGFSFVSPRATRHAPRKNLKSSRQQFWMCNDAVDTKS
jgi:hypothetical protein